MPPVIALFSISFDCDRLDASPWRYRDPASTEGSQAKVVELAPFVEFKWIRKKSGFHLVLRDSFSDSASEL